MLNPNPSRRSPRPLPALARLGLALMALAVACSDGTQAASPDAGGQDMKQAGGEAGADAALAPLQIPLKSGPVKGVAHDKSRAFLGIPYAAPPVGSGRWQAPKPVTPWSAVRDASAFGASCPQDAKLGFGLPAKFSEDCLTLNVFAPRTVPGKPAPTMVWLHGGGFISGGSALPSYNGRTLAETAGVVVVTLNYRLGPLGFLAHAKLEGGATNFGILDQQAALKWVQDNIAAFGGDPQNVTLFGESAGSMSVCVHLASPGSKGLFHRAVMESGACSMISPTLTAAQSQGQDLAKKLSCDAASDLPACLRAVASDKVLAALPTKAAFIFGTGISWSPVVDGKVLSGQPYQLVKDGTIHKVPLIIGTNKDEGTLFLFLILVTQMTEAQYSATVTMMYGAKAADVLKQYPSSAYKATAMLSAPALAFADMITDMAFVCQTRLTLQAAAGAGITAYQYHFTVTQQNALLGFLGATHTAEIPFVFGSDNKLTAAEQTLSRAMMGYWTRFAATGDPNGAGATAWPKYDKTGDAYLELSAAITARTALKKPACAFWDTMPAPSF